MKKVLFVLFLLLSLSCEKGYVGILGFKASDGCATCEDLTGTRWREEGVHYSVLQAWTIVFSTSTTFENWWGVPGNYYQNKAVVGTYTFDGKTVTFKGTGVSNTGTIKGNVMTLDGLAYKKI